MTTTEQTQINRILKDLYLSVNGTEQKVSTGMKGSLIRTINALSFDDKEANYNAIAAYRSPYPEINVKFDGEIITIEGATFKYQFAPEMILHISNQFAKIKPVTDVKKIEAVKALPEVKQAVIVPEIKPKQAVLNVAIVDYSERAIAIIGDTIKIKDILKELGCRYNKFLSCGAGWIASKRNIEAIKKELSKLTFNVQIN